ncbi:Rab GDP dissociation inhibitor alpha [Stylosanthes scabra]|uniref:Rab GDP dissociation inhibitor alpha n=1 Tax=Stylosanthes scabra TaxID=79078 RepID=A0ABU6S6R9_9FABA|nr:Rab GDP dissociation inhibitor alpha [Stylosanthes scabra]
MAAAVGTVSTTTTTKDNVPSLNKNHLEKENKNNNNVVDQCEEQHSEIEEDDENKSCETKKQLDLGPQVSLKENLEKDKDDESLRKWKEQLLGNVDVSAVGESKDPEVKILKLSITSPDRDEDIILPIPFTHDPKKALFVLKEGSKFRMKFTFTVSNNIVSGLKYTNTVWKAGVRVDSRNRMCGTFSPQKEPYIYELEEETTPVSIFARGSYAARTKFVDDDRRCYLDVSYYFEIRKTWGGK